MYMCICTITTCIKGPRWWSRSNCTVILSVVLSIYLAVFGQTWLATFYGHHSTLGSLKSCRKHFRLRHLVLVLHTHTHKQTHTHVHTHAHSHTHTYTLTRAITHTHVHTHTPQLKVELEGKKKKKKKKKIVLDLVEEEAATLAAQGAEPEKEEGGEAPAVGVTTDQPPEEDDLGTASLHVRVVMSHTSGTYEP